MPTSRCRGCGAHISRAGPGRPAAWCDDCRARLRGSPHYGPQHRALREHWQARLEAEGRIRCCQPLCVAQDRWIRPGQSWDLAHTPDGGGYFGPAHAACNRRDGGVRSHGGPPEQAAKASAWATSRKW